MPGSSSGTQGAGTDVAGTTGQSGSAAGSQSGSGAAGIDYGSGDDPFAGLGKPGNGPMTTADRRAVLDARLEESYAVFDGMIIGEREKAQNEANAAGSDVMGTGAGGEGGAGGDGASGDGGGLPGSVIVASGPAGATGGGYLPGGAAARQGEYSNQNQPSFPVPDDIPGGNDDDVVARQLREAATHEPDPELREKLWDEYRKYTGLSQ